MWAENLIKITLNELNGFPVNFTAFKTLHPDFFD